MCHRAQNMVVASGSITTHSAIVHRFVAIHSSSLLKRLVAASAQSQSKKKDNHSATLEDTLKLKWEKKGVFLKNLPRKSQNDWNCELNTGRDQREEPVLAQERRVSVAAHRFVKVFEPVVKAFIDHFPGLDCYVKERISCSACLFCIITAKGDVDAKLICVDYLLQCYPSGLPSAFISGLGSVASVTMKFGGSIARKRTRRMALSRSCLQSCASSLLPVNLLEIETVKPIKSHHLLGK